MEAGGAFLQTRCLGHTQFASWLLIRGFRFGSGLDNYGPGHLCFAVSVMRQFRCGFRLGFFRNHDVILHHQRATRFCQARGDAFVLDDAGLAFYGRDATLYRNREVFRVDFRFGEFCFDVALDLSVRKSCRTGHRFCNRCCVAQPRECDGQSQRGDKLSHAFHRLAELRAGRYWPRGYSVIRGRLREAIRGA
jgi:hypothetical protein